MHPSGHGSCRLVGRRVQRLLTVEEKVSGHHVSRDMDDHGIVGMTWCCVELDGDGAQHDGLLVHNVGGYAKTRSVCRHDILTAVVFSEREATCDVVCMCVGGNGVHQLQSLRIDQLDVVAQKVVNGVHQGSLVRVFIDDEIGHGPNALVQLLKSHGLSQIIHSLEL